MLSSNSSDSRGGGTLRTLLQRWRSERGKSQLEVALQAGISQRHLSFVESGRSIPSRDMLLLIAEALAMPLRERNLLLLSAGYAPLFSEAAWNDAEMRSITAAVDRMLKQQEPYPAVLMDRHWNVVSANVSSAQFFSRFIDIHGLQARTGRRNLLHLMFDPAGMRPFIHDWPTVSRALLQRVRREAVGGFLDDGAQQLLADLSAYPDVPDKGGSVRDDNAAELPMIPLSFVKDDMVLRYFSMVSTVGTPRTIASQELRVECLFPADQPTEARHIDLMQQPPEHDGAER